MAKQSLIRDVILGLAEEGIRVDIDGSSLIFTDVITGVKIIDVMNGIGPRGAEMALRADMLKTSKDIAKLIKVDISDHQFAALTSFALHIGIENFAKSKALYVLNQGLYELVPAQMKKWRIGIKGKGTEPNIRQDYVDRRAYEIELFTTPDWLDLPTDMYPDVDPTTTQVSFRALREQLLDAKAIAYEKEGIVKAT